MRKDFTTAIHVAMKNFSPSHVLSKACLALFGLHGNVADSRADIVLPDVQLETRDRMTH